MMYYQCRICSYVSERNFFSGICPSCGFNYGTEQLFYLYKQLAERQEKIIKQVLVELKKLNKK